MGYADPLPTEESYAKNRHILAWWTEEHDQLLRTAINQEQWIWYWSIADKICAITPKDVIDDWRARDPICNKYAWSNVLMYFAAARAKQLGFLKKVRKPRRRKCASCNKLFEEDSIPPSIVRHLGVDQIDICLPCINSYFDYGKTRYARSESHTKRWIKELAAELNIIPPQSILTDLSVLSALTTEERSKLLQFGSGKPSLESVKAHFGSWLKALIAAEVLEDGRRETSRGTQCIAKDGHVCLSYGEKTIDDFLSSRSVEHEKEPSYPETNYRADFRVGDYFIEYFGMAGDEGYDERAEEKRKIAKVNGIPLVGLYPDDLLSRKKLARKLKPAIESLDA